MPSDSISDRLPIATLPQHRNNIGLIRIVLASLVILSHSVEFAYGSRAREPLTQLFGTLSLGDVALTAFFILSGYLISRSFDNTRSGLDFFLHRVARIYPAFIVAFFVAILVEAPLIGLSPQPKLGALLLDAVFLHQPVINNVHLNTPAWTIVFEFRCYLLTLILGSLGILKHRRIIVLLLCASAVMTWVTFNHLNGPRITAWQQNWWWDRGPGEIRRVFQFGTSYLAGTCVYLFWDEIRPRLTPLTAAAALIACIALLGIDIPSAYVAVSILGAVPLFWLAMRADFGQLQRINDRWDISYGTYLYGWIIQTLLIEFIPSLSAIKLTLLAIPLAWLVGTLSWILVERNSKNWFRRRQRATVV